MHTAYRIGIDCRLSGKKHAGIGRYIENLITRLPQLAPEITWYFFFADNEQASIVSSVPNVQVVLAAMKHYSFAEQVQLPPIIAAQRLDLLHVPHFNIPLLYRGNIVITIHDLLWHEQKGADMTTLPMWQYAFKHMVYKHVVQQAATRAQRIFAPAHTVRQTIERYYPDVAHKIVVTKEGIAATYQHVTNTHQTVNPYQLIYVGSLYPHKNVRLVIDALTQMPEYTLLIAGTRTVFQDDLRTYVTQKKLDEQVHFLGYVSDEKLIQLYQQSLALVQPSLSEGFGLTGVEAMAAGTAVLASDIPIFREIYQSAAAFFDPYSGESLRASITALTLSRRTQLIEEGRKCAAQYSWDAMAQETLHTYRQVLSHHEF